MSLHQEIKKLIKSQSYLNCLLLVHPELNVLRKFAEDLQKNYNFPYLDIGNRLSEALLPIKLGERTGFTRQWFERELSDFTSDPVLITNIDLLFEPSLQLDPMQHFRGLGRKAKLVVIWPGEFDDTCLSYAIPEHRNYQVWQNPDIQIYRIH